MALHVPPWPLRRGQAARAQAKAAPVPRTQRVRAALAQRTREGATRGEASRRLEEGGCVASGPSGRGEEAPEEADAQHRQGRRGEWLGEELAAGPVRLHQAAGLAMSERDPAVDEPEESGS